MIREAILAYFITNAGPGKSLYSFEPVDACGSDPEVAACELEPVCENMHDPRCRAPRWSRARNAWVKVESRERAVERFTLLAEVLEETAVRLVDCWDLNGVVDEECEAAGWPRGRGQARELAMAAASVSIWESGLREDIQGGFPPAGRGAGGEACVMQIMPNQIAPMADWLPKDERSKARKADEHEALAQSLAGLDRASLVRCVSTGMRMLSRARRICRGKGVSWDYGMFTMYGTGNRCSRMVPANEDFALKRQKTFHIMRVFDPSKSLPTR